MTHDHTLDAGPGTHGSEPDAQGLNPWMAPTLVRLDAGDAEFLALVGPDFVAQSS
jgi:hypothetical protein